MDRIITLQGIPEELIKSSGFMYLLEDDYLSEEALLLKAQEITALEHAHQRCYHIYTQELERIIKTNDWGMFDFPPQLVELIQFSYEHRHKHLIGRFDFAGGIDGLPIKLLEFNADTPTMIPESSVIQEALGNHVDYKGSIGQYNTLARDLGIAFNRLGIEENKRSKSLLVSSLGYDEDRINASFIGRIAAEEGFQVDYADLPDVQFAVDEGVFLETNGEYYRYEFLYKLIPWEFIAYEEPELLSILHNLVLQNYVYIMNPAYTIVFQHKGFLTKLSERYADDFLLATHLSSKSFSNTKYVEKVVLGRLGENITIRDEHGAVVQKTDGDFGAFAKVYQDFAQLYQDTAGDYYQLGMFNVDTRASCISFRRGENMIIDDDAEFVGHFVTEG